MNIRNTRIFFTGSITFIILFPVFYLVTGCSKEDRYVSFTSYELNRLLSGDSTKNWIRNSYRIDGKEQDLSECDLKLKYRFIHFPGSAENFYFQIIRDSRYCGGQDSLLETGVCMISDFKNGPGVYDTLSFIANQDTVNYAIQTITSMIVNIKAKNNGKLNEIDLEWTD